MFKKLSDKFSKGIVYLAAFLVTALMAVMMIHIVKESIPAISQLGIKMFLPTTEWRPVSQKPQYGLLPAIAGTLYVSAIAVVLALIFGVACACFLDYYLPKKVASIFLAFIDLVAGIPSVISCKSLCHPPPYGSRSMYPGSRNRAGDHAFTIRYFHLS